MDNMVEPHGARDVLPIPRCRQLLGDEAMELTDAEVEDLRRHAHVLAHALLEVFLIAAGPDFKRNAVLRKEARTVDVCPTVLSLFGASARTEGRVLRELFA